MLVLRKNLPDVIRRLSQPGEYGLDTETTGLLEKDRLFSLIIHTGEIGYYFNLQSYADIDPDGVLTRDDLRLLQPILVVPGSTFYISNALFDMGMLAKEGLRIRSKVFCTQSLGRVLKNNYPPGKHYSLAASAERIGLEKDESVEKYITKNKLWEWTTIPGKQRRGKNKFFDRVPYSVVSKYAETDAYLHLKVGQGIRCDLDKWDADGSGRPIAPLVRNEQRLLKTLHRMQRRGIRIDRAYTEKALKYETDVIAANRYTFKKMTGEDYMPSPILLPKVFHKLDVHSPKLTPKGNESFDNDALEEIDHPLAKCIQRIRHHEKRAGSYYSSFLYYADASDIVRASIWPGGAETGRFSYSEPSMQNIPKEDSDEDLEKVFNVRECFVPHSDDYVFLDVDYHQQEFRMMLDYAGEAKLIAQINAGADVHQATADLCGITRKQAKTINFGLLYGMGTEKLARSLDITLAEAQHLKNVYFAKLPRVKLFIRDVISRGEQRRFVYNWFGRRCHISSRDFAYILPNHIIQGGAADVLKIAMNKIDAYLLKKKARTGMLLQVHDQLLFGLHRDELELAPDFVRIMEQVYQPRNKMKLTCSVAHSWERWGKRKEVEGYPS